MTAADAADPAPDPPRPAGLATCWVVSEHGLAGTETQARALAEALGFDPAVKRIAVRAPWRALPPRLWLRPLAALAPGSDPLAPPWPDLVIASGRKAAAPAAALRRITGGATRAVFVQAPPLPPARFDVVVAPRHDRLTGPNVVPVTGALTRITRARLDAAARRFAPQVAHLPRPRVAILIGGSSKAHRLTAAVAHRLARDLRAMAAATGCSFLITTSRRTGADNARILQAALSDTPHVFYQAGVSAGDNPLHGFLALADEIVVTEDSVTMACEAAGTGVPVQVVPLAGGKPKFDRFHAELRARGVTRPFDGRLGDTMPQPLDETRRAAAAVATLLTGRAQPG
jgi:hypothetical protein